MVSGIGEWPPRGWVSAVSGAGGGGGGGRGGGEIKDDPPSKPLPDAITSALKCGCGQGNSVCPIKYKMLQDAFNSGDPVKLAQTLRKLIKMQPDLLDNPEFKKAVFDFAAEKGMDTKVLAAEIRTFSEAFAMVANESHPTVQADANQSQNTNHVMGPKSTTPSSLSKTATVEKTNPQPKGEGIRQPAVTEPKNLPKLITLIQDLPKPMAPKVAGLPQSTVTPPTQPSTTPTPTPTAPQLTAITIAVQTAIVAVPNRPLMAPLLSQLAQLPPAVTTAVTQLAQPQPPSPGRPAPVAHPPAVVAVMQVAAKIPEALPVVATALATVQAQTPAQLSVVTPLVQSLTDQAPKQLQPMMTAIQTIATQSPQILPVVTQLLAPITKPDSPVPTPKTVAAMVATTQTIATVASQPQLVSVLPALVALVQQAPAVVAKLAPLIQSAVAETPTTAPQVLQSVLTGVSRGSMPGAAVVALATIAQAQPAAAAAALPVLTTVAAVAPKLTGPVVKLIVEVATQSPSQLPTVMATLQDTLKLVQPAPNPSPAVPVLEPSPQPGAQPTAKPQLAESGVSSMPKEVRSEVQVVKPNTVQFQPAQTVPTGRSAVGPQLTTVVATPNPASQLHVTPTVHQGASLPPVTPTTVAKPEAGIASVITTLRATVLSAAPQPVPKPSISPAMQPSAAPASKPVDPPVLASSPQPAVSVQPNVTMAPKLPVQQSGLPTQPLQPENPVSVFNPVQQPIVQLSSKPVATPIPAERINLPRPESKPETDLAARAVTTEVQPQSSARVSLASSGVLSVSETSVGNMLVTASSSPSVASNASGSSSGLVSTSSANTGSSATASYLSSAQSAPAVSAGLVMGQGGGVAARGVPFVPLQAVVSQSQFQQPLQPSPTGRPTPQTGTVQMSQGPIASPTEKIAVALKAFIQQFPELALAVRSVLTAALARFPELAQALSATLQSLMQLPALDVKAVLASLSGLLSNPQITATQVRMVLTVIQAIANQMPEMMPRFTIVLDKLAQLGPQNPLFNELMATMELISQSNRTDAAIRLLQVLKLAEKALGETPDLQEKLIQELRRIRKSDRTQTEENRERFASTEALIQMFDHLEMEQWKMAALFRRRLAKTGTEA